MGQATFSTVPVVQTGRMTFDASNVSEEAPVDAVDEEEDRGGKDSGETLEFVINAVSFADTAGARRRVTFATDAQEFTDSELLDAENPRFAVEWAVRGAAVDEGTMTVSNESGAGLLRVTNTLAWWAEQQMVSTSASGPFERELTVSYAANTTEGEEEPQEVTVSGTVAGEAVEAGASVSSRWVGADADVALSAAVGDAVVDELAANTADLFGGEGSQAGTAGVWTLTFGQAFAAAGSSFTTDVTVAEYLEQQEAAAAADNNNDVVSAEEGDEHAVKRGDVISLQMGARVVQCVNVPHGECALYSAIVGCLMLHQRDDVSDTKLAAATMGITDTELLRLRGLAQAPGYEAIAHMVKKLRVNAFNGTPQLQKNGVLVPASQMHHIARVLNRDIMVVRADRLTYHHFRASSRSDNLPVSSVRDPMPSVGPIVMQSNEEETHVDVVIDFDPVERKLSEKVFGENVAFGCKPCEAPNCVDVHHNPHCAACNCSCCKKKEEKKKRSSRTTKRYSKRRKKSAKVRQI
jgi:sulfur carrier protein ThiS